MDVLWDIVVAVGHAIEQVLLYVETHHWIFGFLAGGYIFFLHDRGLHARFDALDKRVDEIRKRLAVEYCRIRRSPNRIRRALGVRPAKSPYGLCPPRASSKWTSPLRRRTLTSR